MLPVRVLGGGVGGAVRHLAAGGGGVVLAAAARGAAHVRGRAVPHRQPGALLPEQLEGTPGDLETEVIQSSIHIQL